ncbi:hypothetical protein J6590_081125 [Homalodisca vitripennis]|nr:hypothetical protein J6590_081125 [Homalodisca vitripennis]
MAVTYIREPRNNERRLCPSRFLSVLLAILNSCWVERGDHAAEMTQLEASLTETRGRGVVFHVSLYYTATSQAVTSDCLRLHCGQRCYSSSFTCHRATRQRHVVSLTNLSIDLEHVTLNYTEMISVSPLHVTKSSREDLRGAVKLEGTCVAVVVALYSVVVEKDQRPSGSSGRVG